MKICGVVYTIIDGTNDMEYVGKTARSVEKRFNEHAREDSYIGRAMRAHGVEMFTTAILRVCYSKEELDKWERHMIRSRYTKSPNSYNCTDGGEGVSGYSLSAEARTKRTGENNSFFGKHHTAETKAIISTKNKGRRHTDAEREQMSKRRKGVPKSSAHSKSISIALKGKTRTQKHCLNISIAKRGYSPYKNLIAELNAQNLTYTALAKRLGLEMSGVARKMRGECNFTERDKIKLVEIFGKPIEYLLQRDDG